jgi:hypothetical protein
MRDVRSFPLLLFLPALLLSGCSVKNINLFSTPKATKTPTTVSNLPPVATISAPSIAAAGFDSYAGNCPDAADEDVTLINYAKSENYNFDMQLQIHPTQGCDADHKSSTYKSFIKQVTQANLLLNALDTAWTYGYVSTRDTFLTNVLSQLQAHYPSLSNATITVNFGGTTRATVTYTGHGAPVVNDLYSGQ